ncbi:MAG: hypothetical protein LC642_07475 [Verrucomicrobiaceae bacterium]|nr:hypothetical protein [Verrucomicrobiaceae bacterium]
MTLTDEQKQQVATWIEQGLRPSDIQSKLESAFALRVTYMEVRFLIDDLKLTLKDPEPPVPHPAEEPAAEPAVLHDPETPAPAAGAAKVSLKIDAITRAGALVSGRVTFSDGKTGEWYLDQMGRLGMVPPDPGYRPPQSDLADFQVALEKELAKLGM